MGFREFVGRPRRRLFGASERVCLVIGATVLA